MRLTEIDLDKDISNDNEGNQEGKSYLSDLNANVEELDCGFNHSHCASILHISSSIPFPFDLNGELSMEDDTHMGIGDILPEPNLNTGVYRLFYFS